MAGFFGDRATWSDVLEVAEKIVRLSWTLEGKLRNQLDDDNPFDPKQVHQYKPDLELLLAWLDSLLPVVSDDSQYARMREWLGESREYVTNMLNSLSYPDYRVWRIDCHTIAVHGNDAVKPFRKSEQETNSAQSAESSKPPGEPAPFRFGEYVTKWDQYEQLMRISKDEFHRAGNVLNTNSPMFPLWMQAHRTQKEYVELSCDLRNDPGYQHIRVLCNMLWGEELSHGRLLKIRGLACDRLAKHNGVSVALVIGAVDQSLLVDVAAIFEDPPAPERIDDKDRPPKEGPWYLCDPKDSPDPSHTRYRFGPIEGEIGDLVKWIDQGTRPTIEKRNGRYHFFVRRANTFYVWFDRDELFKAAKLRQDADGDSSE